MRKFLGIVALLLLSAIPSQAQGVRLENPGGPVVSAQIPGGQIYSVSNAVINFCSFPNINVPCTNLAQTYSDISLGTPCPTNAPITLAGSNTCVGTTDPLGNWGVWIAAGTYTWTVQLPGGGVLGPYAVTISAGSGGGGTVTNTTGSLTAGQPVLGNGGADIKVGPVNIAGGSGFIIGNLPINNLGGGLAAGPTTFWRGDGTWAVPAGGGGGGTPCVLTALSLQYNNAGAFGCVPDFTFTSPHTLTVGALGIINIVAGGTITGITPAMIPTLNQPTTGQSGTSLALTGPIVPCAAGQAFPGILANGNSSGCFNVVANPMTTIGDMIGAAASGTPARIVGGLSRQVPVATNGATPAFSSPGLLTGNGGAAVTTTPYVVKCDSGTSVLDRLTVIILQSGAGVVTVPDPSSAGCGGNMAFVLLDDGGGTVAVNRTTTAVFNIANGSTNSDAQTTFNLTNGQYATFNAGDNTNWTVRVVSGGGGGGTPCVVTALSLQFNNAGAFGCVTPFTFSGSTITAAAAGIFDLSGATGASAFKVPVLAGAVAGANGVIDYDTTAGNTHQRSAGADSISVGEAAAIVTNTIPKATDSTHGLIVASSIVDNGTTVTTAEPIAVGGSPPACAGSGAGPGCFTEGTAATAVATVDDLHADSTQHAIAVNNNNTGEMMLSRVTCVNVTPVTVNANVTTDQNLITCTLAANLLNVTNRTIHVHAAGIYSTAASSTAVLTAKAKLCTASGCGSGTVISLVNIVSAAIATKTVANNNWSLDFYGTTQTAGATAAFESHGQFAVDLDSSTATADQVYGDTNAATVGTIDTTGQLFLQISFAYSAASASNSVSQRQEIMEVLN